MRITKLRLRQFKRFDDLTIDLGLDPPRIVALVGPNGCGKSSIFDAFQRRFQQIKAASTNRAESFYDKAPFRSDGAPAEVLNRDQKIDISTIDGNVLGLTSFHLRTAYRFTSDLNVAAIQAQPDIATDTRRPGDSAAVDNALQLNYERLLGIAWDEFEAGEKSGATVRQELLGKINAVLANVLDVRISSIGNVTKSRGRLYFDKDDTKDFPYENLSAGEKEVIDIVIDLVVRATTFSDTIYCIDEPELHLNSNIQRRLLVALETLLPENCQLWIATHSIGFLRALQKDLTAKSAIIDFSAGQYFKGAHIVRPMVTTRANWQRVFETALDDLVGLTAPQRIVYCEGRAQPAPTGGDVGLDAFVYNEVFSESHPDTAFVSSGGNTEAHRTSSLALVVLSKVFQGVELSLLRDRDIMSDSERARWLAQAAHHRMPERREIENYLMDYYVLAAFCADSGPRAIARDEYDAIVSDIKTQDLKLGDTIQKLKRLCGAKGDHDSFKRSLAPFLVETPACIELEASIF